MKTLVETKPDFDIKSTSTIRELKDFLNANKFDVKSTVLIFSNNEQLSPVVFQTSQYDNFTFDKQKHLLKGAKLLSKRADVKEKTCVREVVDNSITIVKNKLKPAGEWLEEQIMGYSDETMAEEIAKALTLNILGIRSFESWGEKEFVKWLTS